MTAGITYRRLSELEIAAVKTMRSWGLPRDLIMSFVQLPGRILTPAAIKEIIDGEGSSGQVRAASTSATKAFALERIASSRPVSGRLLNDPMSPWRIEQTLLWASLGQLEMFPREGNLTEFKIIFKTDRDSIAKYMKTMASYANREGGYLFFGIDNKGNAVEFNAEHFFSYNWIGFGQQLQSRFSGYIDWDYAIADVPGRPEFQFDARMIVREAKARKLRPEQYEWALKPDVNNTPKRVGVIYVRPSQNRVTCTKTVGDELKNGETYIRIGDRNGTLSDAGLNDLQDGSEEFRIASSIAERTADFDRHCRQGQRNNRMQTMQGKLFDDG